MTAFRNHLHFLEKTDDRCRLERPESPPPQVVAAQSLEAGGPTLEFVSDGPELSLASGVYGGVDGMRGGDRHPWTRLGIGLGVDRDPDYVDVLETLLALGDRIDDRDVTYVARAASTAGRDLRELAFPTPPDESWPRFTLGVLSVGTNEGSYWAPIHGSVLDRDTVRARIPESVTDRLERGDAATIALGVPAEALAATYLLAITDRLSTPIEELGVGREVPVVPTAGGVVPSATEVVIEGVVADRQPATRSEKQEFWERLVDGTTLTLEVTDVFTREDPTVPFTPLDVPLSDDLQLTALALSATLYDRANSYWGISPVEWLSLPAEGRLGICFVSSEVLYAGFEWQLANFLFSLSDCFDKVVVVDEETGPREFGQVLGDMWVKAHPSRDWVFSEREAPPARMPAYGQSDDTGARLYVDATWDPRWREEYIAPRVSFSNSYPTGLREAVRDSWPEFGFDGDLEF